jgi:hypothetical protein
MNRFPQEALFDRLASVGALGIAHVPIGGGHRRLSQVGRTCSDHGGKAGMSWVVEGNAAGFAEFGRSCLDPSAASFACSARKTSATYVGFALTHLYRRRLCCHPRRIGCASDLTTS